MARAVIFALAVNLLTVVAAEAQTVIPGSSFNGAISAGEGVQTYPFDQQETWIHGHFQRYPAYGGFSSFRPYNYRHVMAQSQIAAVWGAPHGMPYSQQFWNKYRGSYLDGHMHHQSPQNSFSPAVPPPALYPTPVQPIHYQSMSPPDRAAVRQAPGKLTGKPALR
jgi:hypothetical protein